MKQGVGKIKDLRDLLIRCNGLTPDEIEQLGRTTFSEIFLTDSRRGSYATHDGQRVVFFNDAFDHAFFASPEKVVLDIERVERINWILPLIQGDAPNSECWEVSDSGMTKRVYLCFGLGYVVWLKERLNGGWKFITAYPAFRAQIRKYIRNGKRIASFK